MSNRTRQVGSGAYYGGKQRLVNPSRGQRTLRRKHPQWYTKKEDNDVPPVLVWISFGFIGLVLAGLIASAIFL